MANNGDGNELNILAPLSFTGMPRKAGTTDNSVSATDFLRTITSRKASQDWDDVKTMRMVRAALTDEASLWFNDHMFVVLLPAEYTDFTTKFATHFVPAFKKAYKVTCATLQVDWVDLCNQRHTETVGAYMTRVFTALRAVGSHVKGLPLTGRHTPQAIKEATVAALATIPTEANRTLVDADLRDKEAHDQASTTEATCAVFSNVIARKIVVAGLRAEPLRTAAHNYDRDKPNDRDFMEALTDAARRYEESSHNNGGSSYNKKRQQRVHEVDEQDDSEVDAVRPGANGSKLSAAKRAANKNKVCNFCKAKFHLEAECNKKKRQEQKKAGEVLFENSSETQNLRDFTTTESGNPGARW
jgi:hypothetical protein